jgi:hypothetical protein
LVRKHGHEIVWLPPYHPELNPIERHWGTMKNTVRSNYNDKPITAEQFTQRIKNAAATITSEQWSGSVERSLMFAYQWAEHDGIDVDNLPIPSNDDDGIDFMHMDYSTIDDISDDDVDADDDDDDEIEVEVIPDPSTYEEKVEIGSQAGVVGSSKVGRLQRKPFKLLTEQQKKERHWYNVWGAPSEKFTFGLGE